MKTTPSWGRYPVVEQELLPLYWRNQSLPETDSMLAYGKGRSYGDVCLNDSGIVIPTSNLQRYIYFDEQNGILRAEAGVTLADVLALVMPKGWFLAVTPGTKFVSLGGAVANDVHGKNHHCAGSFGCHVRALELQRSDGERLICTADENSEWFHATIGGLGLTGLISWVEIKLKHINSYYIDQEVFRFKNLESFFKLNEEIEGKREYTVAWIDCLARGKNLGRGLYLAGEHSEMDRKAATTRDVPALNIPMDAPGWLLNKYSVHAFNIMYYHLPRKHISSIHYDSYFYPLDKLANWNRLYGKNGFFQYQCVIPVDRAELALSRLLKLMAKSGQVSFLSVLKKFGNLKAPGLLSFPRSGVTLAVDIPNRGAGTLQLLEKFDAITMENNGAVYPAKDARMSAAAFQAYFPNWKIFSKFIDPHFSSSFWRRVSQ